MTFLPSRTFSRRVKERKPAHDGIEAGRGQVGDPRELLLEVVSPVVGQRCNSGDAPQPSQIGLVAGVEASDLGDRRGIHGSLDQNDRVSRLDLAFGNHSERETGTATGEKSFDDIVTTKSQAQFEAGHSRLGDDELSGTMRNRSPS